MTNEQQRKMLDCAAKACGIDHKGYCDTPAGLILFEDTDALKLWNTLANALDTAEMCAKLEIHIGWNTEDQEAVCIDLSGKHMIAASYADHDNSSLKAWMFAATMVAAKVGGYTA